MASINYNEIQSRFMIRVQAYDLAEISDDVLSSFFYEWVHSALSKQHILNLFSELSTDDNIQQVTYEMKYPSGFEQIDRDFVIDVLSRDFILSWLEPQVKSTVNTKQVFGSKEEKYYSQSEHMKRVADMYYDTMYDQKSMIADRNVMHNGYL